MVQGQVSEFELGPVHEFNSFPAQVEVEGRRYFVAQNAGRFYLFSSVCPHKGGQVELVGGQFQCPRHGWEFSGSDGTCINAPGERLVTFDLVVRDGRLIANLPRRATANFRRGPLETAVKVSLHAHACLEFQIDGFSLLTDPWLEGPAFLGSWVQYPPPVVSAGALQPDAIWISHEHSDHFHPETLRGFDPSTPVYVPDFPNRRLPAALEQIGFREVHVIEFGEPVRLGKDIVLTCFEPSSLWNDAIALIEVGGLKFLNLNDAGVNHRIADLIGPVDVVASSFSPGASGYPLTWEHLDRHEKTRILEQSREGSLEMLKACAEVYGASRILPFASFFSLWHPDHLRYVAVTPRNTPDDVVAFFAESEVAVLDLLPGERWNVRSSEIERRSDRNDFGSRKNLYTFLKDAWDPEVFERFHPLGEPPSRQTMAEYFLRLNDVPDIAFCEDLTVLVKSHCGRASLAIDISAGELRILPSAPAQPNVTIALPAGVLRAVIEDDLSWDEALIGYWGRLDRSPDVYHAGFWRLLQAPYYRRPLSTVARFPGSLTPETPIAEITEIFGDDADRVMRRHGLYCVGCHKAPFESIAQGAAQHGLAEGQVDRLLQELQLLADSLPVASESR